MGCSRGEAPRSTLASRRRSRREASAEGASRRDLRDGVLEGAKPPRTLNSDELLLLQRRPKAVRRLIDLLPVRTRAHRLHPAIDVRVLREARADEHVAREDLRAEVVG